MGNVARATGNAVAERDKSPRGLIKEYSADFASVLPTHVKSAQWIRLAEGALKKGRRIDVRNDPNYGRFELEVAAQNNPGVFLAALLDAARLGLEPGTEQYYLTPRKVKGRLEILGIVGYQGHIELMYRAGAVASVVAEVVRENDEYEFQPGQLDRQQPPRWIGPQLTPWHKYPPFSGQAERGRLIGVYAYAHMSGGAVSRVIQLGQEDIARIKASSQGAESDYSPWKNHEVAMWLKSAVRQLQKWVPTSAEFRREQLRARAEASRVSEERQIPPATSEFLDPADSIDGEVVDPDAPAEAQAEAPDAEAWPETPAPGGVA